MAFHIDSFDLRLIPQILDNIPVAVTIFDLEGTMQYYNEYSLQIVNRKPEYLGKDIRLCHQKPESNQRIDQMIEEFQKGRRKPFSYETKPYGKVLMITVTPLEVQGRLVGCIHTAIPKP
jgi:PAS domain S-box-containing protein